MRPLRPHAFALLGFDTCPAPSIVGEPLPIPPQNSTALIGASSELELVNDAAVSSTVSQLVQANAFCGRGTIPFAHTPLHLEVAHKLYDVGYLELRKDDFGDLVIALNPIAILWQPVFGVHRPVVAFVSNLFSNPLKCTKLKLIVFLQSEGFEFGEPIGPCMPDSELFVYCDLSRPLSYFAAVVSRKEILKKGVEAIPHHRSSVFYFGLLRLHGPRLKSCLELPAEAVDDALKLFLKAEDLVDEVQEDKPSLDISFPHDSEPLGAIVPVAHVQVPLVGWTRCVAHTGAASRMLRIYFDQFVFWPRATRLCKVR